MNIQGNRETRREGLLIDAINPVNGKVCKVQISHDRMQKVSRRSLGHASELAYIVPFILQNPNAIFEGLRWDEDEDPKGQGWRCYCGIPDKAYHADGTAKPPWEEQVYLVFVNIDGVAYNWRWEKQDSEYPGLPEDHEGRFKKRIL